MKLSGHSPEPPPDTTQGWGDPSPDPLPRQTAPASPPPVPPSNPLGQARPPPGKCQTWNTGCVASAPDSGPEGPATAADNSAKGQSVFWGTWNGPHSRLRYIASTQWRSRRPSESLEDDSWEGGDGDLDAVGE
ncbi:hypothetical protein C0989_010609 [Termitomyces sp. Mn162]|nr:hypothetical protein C0989_010609 [Termitomyces sp. Mn162]